MAEKMEGLPERTMDQCGAEGEPLPPGVWVVGGQTGEYSDRSEWTTYAFRTEVGARSYVEFLTSKRQELAPQGDYLDWGQRVAVGEAMRAFDPEYSEDYTGSSWTAWFLPFAPADAPEEASPPSSERAGSRDQAKKDLPHA
jgi:hypothetical protein